MATAHFITVNLPQFLHPHFALSHQEARTSLNNGGMYSVLLSSFPLSHSLSKIRCGFVFSGLIVRDDTDGFDQRRPTAEACGIIFVDAVCATPGVGLFHTYGVVGNNANSDDARETRY